MRQVRIIHNNTIIIEIIIIILIILILIITMTSIFSCFPFLVHGISSQKQV